MTSNKENEFIDIVQNAGYLALREPASGAKNDLDVVMVVDNRLYFVEHKYAGTADNAECRFVVEEDYKGDPGDIVPMIEEAERVGAVPVLACRFAYDSTHYLVDAYEYVDHHAGSIGFKEKDKDEMIPLETIFTGDGTGFESKPLSKVLKSVNQ